MAFDFPANPTNGQTVTLGTSVFQWNGSAWNMQSGNIGPQGPPGPEGPQGPPGTAGPTGGVTIEISDTAPPTPAEKSMWWQSNTGALWVRFNDGNSVQWVQVNSNLILPPQDGNEYVMRNGLWRLKSQTLNLDGVSAAVGAPVAVPVGARAVKFSGLIALNNSATSIQPTLRCSLDGATFLAGASDYGYSGSYFPSSSAAATNLPTTAAAFALLGIQNTTALFGCRIDGSMNLVRQGNSFQGHSYGSSLQAAAHYQSLIQFWNNANFGAAPNAIKALSFGCHSGTGTMFDSYVDLEWAY